MPHCPKIRSQKWNYWSGTGCHGKKTDDPGIKASILAERILSSKWFKDTYKCGRLVFVGKHETIKEDIKAREGPLPNPNIKFEILDESKNIYIKDLNLLFKANFPAFYNGKPKLEEKNDRGNPCDFTYSIDKKTHEKSINYYLGEHRLAVIYWNGPSDHGQPCTMEISNEIITLHEYGYGICSFGNIGIYGLCSGQWACDSWVEKVMEQQAKLRKEYKEEESAAAKEAAKKKKAEEAKAILKCKETYPNDRFQRKTCEASAALHQELNIKPSVLTDGCVDGEKSDGKCKAAP